MEGDWLAQLNNRINNIEWIPVRQQRCTFLKQVLDCDVKAHNRLKTAIRCKNKDLVKQLVDDGVKVNGLFVSGHRAFDPWRDPNDERYSTNHAAFTPLHLAVISRDAEIVKILLDQGADTNTQIWNENGDTPLTMAAKMQNTTITDLLLNHDSISGSSDDDHLTHLHIACMRNNTRVVKKLLLMNQGQHINKAVDSSSVHWAGYTPLHFAVQFECVETVQLLLKSGADIMIKNTRECTPLHLADLNRNEKIIDLILEAHKNEFKNPANSDKLSHFHIACTRNDTSIVEHFLKIGVNINHEVKSSQWYGWRPIHFAMLYECSDVIKLLSKDKVHLENCCFSELLECAYTGENSAIYDPFLRNDLDHSMADENNQKLLIFHQACVQNDREKIEQLIRNHIISLHDFNQPIWNGWTSLHLAVKCKSRYVVNILLNQGTNIVAIDSNGSTPLHLAFKSRLSDVCLNIIDRFTISTPNVTDNEGISFFHILCALGGLQTISNFIRNGVNINSQVGSESVLWGGFTALHFAVKFGQPQVIDILLQHGADVLLKNELNLNIFDFTIDLSSSEYQFRLETTFEILKKIISHTSREHINLNNRGISLLHLLPASEDTTVQQYQQCIDTHRDEIDSTIECPEWEKCTPLHAATVFFGRFDLAESLLRNGANPLIVNGAGHTFIDHTFIFGMSHLRSVDQAERIFTLVSQNQILKPSHFHLACGAGLFNVVKNVLDVIQDSDLKIKYLNFPNDFGQTPLHSLMFMRNDVHSRTKIANLLLKNGADVHARDFELQTALHYAPLKSEPEVVRLLVNNGANVNAQNIFGQTPLHKLISEAPKIFVEESPDFFFYDQITILLQEGSDLDITDRRGQTFLMMIPDVRASGIKRNIACIIVKHVKKLQMVGYNYITEKNQQVYDEISQYQNVQASIGADFIEKCQQEFAAMKNDYIDRYTNLYSILFKTLNSMTVHCDNGLLQKMIRSDEFSQKYPLFGFFIKIQVQNGRERQPLLEESKKILGPLLGRSLPQQCLETIIDYLSNEDLKKITGTS